jgi:raffinose/stachyose/melibiose transport system permease protein
VKTKSALKISFSTLLVLLFLLPFLLVLINSVKPKIEILKNPVALPTSWSLDNYKNAFDSMNFTTGFFNSLLVTGVSVALILAFSAMFAYFLSRWNWKFNKIIFILLVVSMIVPFQALMIPFVKIYGELGLLSSRWMLSFFYLGFGTSLATFMYHGFIGKIPVDLEEAAVIDGATPIQVFFRVVMPLLKTITTTIAILDVLWIWNDFLLPSLVLTEPNQKTLPLSMFTFFGRYSADYGSAMAALVLTMVPILVFYLITQKQIIKGVVEGAVK